MSTNYLKLPKSSNKEAVYRKFYLQFMCTTKLEKEVLANGDRDTGVDKMQSLTTPFFFANDQVNVDCMFRKFVESILNEVSK